jgi:hypothetical protein
MRPPGFAAREIVAARTDMVTTFAACRLISTDYPTTGTSQHQLAAVLRYGAG